MTKEFRSSFCGDVENKFDFSKRMLVFEIIDFKSRKFVNFTIFEL